MTESANAQPATGFVLVEIWKRPWFKSPNCFWRQMSPVAPEPWTPELGMKLIHKSGARCVVTGVREASDTPTLYIIEWELNGEPMRGEFYHEDLLFRFVREDRPTTQWEFSPWEPMPATNAKKALRMGRFMLPESPGVVYGAREFEGRRATQADYDRLAELKRQPGA